MRNAGMLASRAILLLHVVVIANAAGGYLKWVYNHTDAYYPLDTPYAPAVLRGEAPGDERVATVSMESGKWTVSGLSIIDGQPKWNAILPYSGPNDIIGGITTGTSSFELRNSLNLAMLQIPGVLLALDGTNGAQKWQWPIPPLSSIQQVSGWGDTVAMIVKGEPVQSPYFPIAVAPTYIIALDAGTGQQRWQLNGTVVIPSSQADAASYSIESLVVGEGCIVFSRANKMANINPADGSIIWRTQVSLEGSVGTGQGANITNMSYLPGELDQDDVILSSPRLLLNANNWGFQRFVLMAFNTTNITAPATPIWRSKIPETSLNYLPFTNPVADGQTRMFYYWSNRTNWITATSEVYLVGRKLTDGTQVWANRMDPMGLPSVFEGRLFVVGSEGLFAMQGSSGSVIWSIPSAPGQGFSYNVSPTFGNNTGQLVAARCLAPEAPGLCMYSAFAPPQGGATRIMHGMRSTVVAAAVAAFSLIFLFIS